MGRAMHWFKAIFGIKKRKEQNDTPKIKAEEVTWLRSFTEKDQNKQAVAVAVATALAADAAVAAAQAAVVVVRLTSHGRDSTFSGYNSQNSAAVRIQTYFRAYLARKAFKALKGLVKLQALVRGFLVRKEANATLLGIEALIRSQSIVRAKKVFGHCQNCDRLLPDYRVKKMAGKCDDTRSEYKARIQNRRMTSSFDINSSAEMRMILDPARPRSRRPDNSISNEDLLFDVHCKKPARVSTPDSVNSRDTNWVLAQDDCRFSTAQSTPQFVNGPNGPVTPPKSESGTYTVFRNYMADTQSYKAKLRSQSALKQRSDIGPKKRVSLNELIESRNSNSGFRMQRSCSQAQDVISFKNVVMGKLERSCDFSSYRQGM